MCAVAVSARDHRPLVDRVFDVGPTAGRGLDERLALVRSALLRLPPLDRRLLMMTMVSGWQPGAIADAFDLAPAVIRTRSSLALQTVQAFVTTTRSDVEADAACSQPVTAELAARYVGGRLTVEEQTAFEGHYLSCIPCWEALKTVVAVHAALTEDRRREVARARAAALRRWRRRVIASGFGILLVAIGLQRHMSPDPPSRRGVTGATGDKSPFAHEPPAAAGGKAPFAHERPAAPAPPGPAARSQASSLPALARVVAPPYLRRPDEAGGERFAAAMRRYGAREYAGAARVLRPLAREYPSAAPVQFYLGVTELMLGRPDAAIPALDRAASLGTPALSEHAFYLLGQAWLTKSRAEEARRALRACVKRGGAHAAAAADLLKRF